MRNKKILWLVRTSLMLALLIGLQTVTKPLGQLVTGSCVNAILALAALVGGVGCGITIAVLSPIMAFLLGIAPQILTVPAIMVGNTLFVVTLHLLAGKAGSRILPRILAWVAGAGIKAAALYGIVVWLMCNVLYEELLAQGLIKPPMVAVLSANFGLIQFFTALIGGGVALLVAPYLKKLLKKNRLL